MDTHRMGEELAHKWQHLKSSLHATWEKLTHENGHDGSRRPSDIQEDYARSRDRTAVKQAGVTATNTEKKDVFQKMSEVNGDMKLNQYVENPAPGPSERHGPQGENNVRDEKAEKKTEE